MDAIERAKAIRLVIFDVDGVLTDGGLYFDDDGRQYKRFHSRDGHGLRMLGDAGLQTAILTGRRSGVVEHRARELRIDHVIQGQREKLPAFVELCQRQGLTAEQTAYMGDDLLDLPVMRRCGLALAVADAHPLVRQHAHWLSHCNGGGGAVREACEFILRAQGRLEAALARWLD